MLWVSGAGYRVVEEEDVRVKFQVSVLECLFLRNTWVLATTTSML